MTTGRFFRSFSGEFRFIPLLIVSIILVLWQHFGMDVEFDLVPDSATYTSSISHSDSVNGGRSHTRISIDEQSIGIDCEIILSETFAFCGVSIPMVEDPAHGIDMRMYTNIHLEFTYDSPHNDTILVYLINSESTPAGHEYIKSNMWAVNPIEGVNSFDLDISRTHVPSWWIFQNNQPGVDIEPDVSNIVSMQITTGDNVVAREVDILVTKISFYGKWITAEDLYLGLLIAWILFISSSAISSMYTLSRSYKETREQNQRLLSLNSFLQIQKDQYETMAKHDKLTGAFNRAGVRDALRSVITQFKQQGAASSLLIIDIDHFKQINDNYGHDVGDQALINLVDLIDNQTRQQDTFARWGGEEFILICPRTRKDAAMRLAETLRKKIENAVIIQQEKLTCSFGVAEIRSDDIEAWFRAADQALYSAKEAGRNRTMGA